MNLSKLPNKLIIDDKKYLIFLDQLRDEEYIVVSYETYLLDFIDKLLDKVCINNSLCKKYRTSLNQYQLSEINDTLNIYFGKHCIETSIIVKNANKKIVVYDINHEDVKDFFIKHNFKIFEL